MNIAVCICTASDISSRVLLSPRGKSIDPTGITSVLNPYDEYAIEEAIRTKEKYSGTVHVLSVGTVQNREIIKKAIAMGADEGILLIHDAPLDSWNTAEILAESIKQSAFDIVFMGKQTVDFAGSCVGQLTAELCSYSSISSCTSLRIENNFAFGEREIENGIESVKASIPVIVTTEKGINEPRYPHLKGIMAAKKKALIEKNVKAIPSRTKIYKLELSKVKGNTRFLENTSDGIAELVHFLRVDGKIV